MFQGVKHQTLDFGSGHDLMVHEVQPPTGLPADSVVRSLREVLSLPLSSLPAPSLPE